MGMVGIAAVVEWLASVPVAVVGACSTPTKALFFSFFLQLSSNFHKEPLLYVRHKALLYFRRVSHGFSPLYVRHKAPLYFRHVSHGFS